MDFFLLFLLVGVISAFFFSTISFEEKEEEEEENELYDAIDIRLDVLLEKVLDPDEPNREYYQNQILSMGPKIIPRLTNFLSQELFLDQNVQKSQLLKELLCDFGLESVPSFLLLLEEEGDDPHVAETIQEMFLLLGPSSLPFILERSNPSLLKHISPLLFEWGESVVPVILSVLHEEPNKAIWSELLFSQGAVAVPFLREAIRDWSGEAQRVAFYALARLAPKEGRGFFCKALLSKDPSLRKSAVLALGKIGNMDDFRSVALLSNDQDLDVRLQLISSLPKLCSKSAKLILKEKLNKLGADEQSLEERLTVLISLAKLQELTEPKEIEAALFSPHPKIRFLALSLISFQTIPLRLRFLSRLLWDPDASILDATLEQLSEMGSGGAVCVLLDCVKELSKQDPRIPLIEKALLSFEKTATSALNSILQKTEGRMSFFALRVLLEGSDLRALKPILVFFHQKEEPFSQWSCELGSLLLFLERLSEKPGLQEELDEFMTCYPDSYLNMELQEFLDTHSFAVSSSFRINTNSNHA